MPSPTHWLLPLFLVQILSSLVMEELMPTLQTDLLPKMKGKKNDRKRAWLGVSANFALPLRYAK